MDELRNSKSAFEIAASVHAPELPHSGKDLPSQEASLRTGSTGNPISSENSPATKRSRPGDNVHEELLPDSLDNLLTRLNMHVQDEQRDLEFELMNEGALTIVRVSDRTTGEVIRQIPEKEVVDLARKLNAKEPLQLLNALV